MPTSRSTKFILRFYCTPYLRHVMAGKSPLCLAVKWTKANSAEVSIPSKIRKPFTSVLLHREKCTQSFAMTKISISSKLPTHLVPSFPLDVLPKLRAWWLFCVLHDISMIYKCSGKLTLLLTVLGRYGKSVLRFVPSYTVIRWKAFISAPRNMR